jgi:hypothetical protein
MAVSLGAVWGKALKDSKQPFSQKDDSPDAKGGAPGCYERLDRRDRNVRDGILLMVILALISTYLVLFRKLGIVGSVS